MFTLITWNTETSQPETRYNIPAPHCHAMGTSGGFYKVQLVDGETNVIEFEYK